MMDMVKLQLKFNAAVIREFTFLKAEMTVENAIVSANWR